MTRLTNSVTYFVCSQGKSKARDSFAWSCPNHIVDNVNVMKLWFHAADALKKQAAEIAAVYFDSNRGTAGHVGSGSLLEILFRSLQPGAYHQLDI
jgi:hypothetical protein